MSPNNENARESFETQPEPSIWEKREEMLSEEETRRLSADKGKGQEGAVRADQKGRPGPQPEGNPAARADLEGGVSGQFHRKVLEESERGEHDEWAK
jgi:hypothetical protein